MKRISEALSHSELQALVQALAHSLHHLQPDDALNKLIYLHLMRCYQRLAPKVHPAGPQRRIGFRPEEACALVVWFHSPAGQLSLAGPFEEAVVNRLLSRFHQRLS